MPIPQGTLLNAIPAMLPERIAAYNAPGTRTARYNLTYNHYIVGRTGGIAAGGLSAWIAGGGAVIAIQSLLTSFGMNARNSVLVPAATLQAALNALHAPTLDWISTLSLPLPVPPPAIVNPNSGTSLAGDLHDIYDSLGAPGAVTASGGYVAASKALHCLFPNLAPMIDGEHTGLSLSRIARATYTAPLGLGNWALWVGVPLAGVPNPSPQGAGRTGWDWTRFVAAIGISQHIYELWQGNNAHPELPVFLALDPAAGTTGVPRIIDKVLW
jgi:hypothetical protein